MKYVYVLKSKTRDELYFGSTTDLKQRMQDHNLGAQASTRRYRPWKLVYYEAYASEKLARLRESRLKQHGNAKRELLARIGLQQKKDRKSGAGFTMVELLVSIAIFVFLSGILLFGFRGAGQANNLRQTSAELAANLRRAQTLAQTGAVVNVCSDWASLGIRACSTDAFCAPATCGVVPQDGFGVRVNTGDLTRYSLFASLNPNHSAAYYYTVSGGDVTMPEKMYFVDYQNDIVIMQRPRGDVFSAALDPYWCIEHPNIGQVRKVTVRSLTGQVEDLPVASCP